MEKQQLLIIEDNHVWQRRIQEHLQNSYCCTVEGTLGRGLKALASSDWDLVILDLNLPDATDLIGLQQLRRQNPTVPVMIMTQDEDPHISKECIRNGATDYINKNVLQKSPDLFLKTVHSLTPKIDRKLMYRSKNPVYQELYDRAKCALSANIPLLILGEMGVGKRVFVQHICQDLFPGKPFVSLDCGSINENLIESELFGHIAGAFTDAKYERSGRIDGAHGGILFLDEIHSASITFQCRLLTLLEEKKFHRVGADIPIQIDFKLITATNMDILQLKQTGKFKADLLSRISGCKIQLPSLRHTPALLEEFIQYYWSYYCQERGIQLFLDSDIHQRLMAHSWEGNLRDLDKEIKNLNYSYSESGDLKCHLSEFSRTPSQSVSTEQINHIRQKSKLDFIRKAENALHQWGGNYSAAARELKISRTTLLNRLKSWQHL